MRKILPLVVLGLPLLLALPAYVVAIQIPQTRVEFVKAVAAGARMTRTETMSASSDFEEVYALLGRKAASCLDVTVERSAYVGYWERSSSDYNPTLRRAGKGKAEFSLQVVHRPRGVGEKPPPGGLYVIAVDVRSLGKDRTEAVLYYPSMGYKPVMKSLRQWIAGEDADCPKMR